MAIGVNFTSLFLRLNLDSLTCPFNSAPVSAHQVPFYPFSSLLSPDSVSYPMLQDTFPHCFRILFPTASVSSPLLQDTFPHCFRILFPTASGYFYPLLQDTFPHCFKKLLPTASGYFSPLIQDTFPHCFRILFPTASGYFSHCFRKTFHHCFRTLFPAVSGYFSPLQCTFPFFSPAQVSSSLLFSLLLMSPFPYSSLQFPSRVFFWLQYPPSCPSLLSQVLASYLLAYCRIICMLCFCPCFKSPFPHIRTLSHVRISFALHVLFAVFPTLNSTVFCFPYSQFPFPRFNSFSPVSISFAMHALFYLSLQISFPLFQSSF